MKLVFSTKSLLIFVFVDAEEVDLFVEHGYTALQTVEFFLVAVELIGVGYHLGVGLGYLPAFNRFGFHKDDCQWIELIVGDQPTDGVCLLTGKEHRGE